MPNLSDLDWQPVLLVKMRHTPFAAAPAGFAVSRMYLAEAYDNILGAPWDTDFARHTPDVIRPVGWRPTRDVPFVLPVRFQRRAAGLSQIPNGTWVLPYNHTHYTLYRHLYDGWAALLKQIDAQPVSPATIGTLFRCISLPDRR